MSQALKEYAFEIERRIRDESTIIVNIVGHYYHEPYRPNAFYIGDYVGNVRPLTEEEKQRLQAELEEAAF